jgi:flagellar biosynthesis protein FlhG
MFSHISTQATKLVSLTKKIRTASKTKIITIASGKGGVGKSTMTVNLAYQLSKQNIKVVALDADIGLANLQVLLNMKPTKTIFDYFDGQASIEDILLKTEYDNITLVAGKSGYEYASNNKNIVFSRIIDEIVSLNKFDIILIDTGAGLNEYVQEFLGLSDNILAITTTDPSALTDVYALIKMISGTKNELMLCFNHTSRYSVGETITNSIVKLAKKNKLDSKFMVRYIGNIPESKYISSTSRLRKLFSKEFSDDYVTQRLESVVEKLLEEIK